MLAEIVAARRCEVVIVDGDHEIAVTFERDQIPDVASIVGIVRNEISRKAKLAQEAVLLLERWAHHRKAFLGQQFTSLVRSSWRLAIRNHDDARLSQPSIGSEILEISVEQ